MNVYIEKLKHFTQIFVAVLLLSNDHFENHVILLPLFEYL